jgi:hypothetical protein
MHEYNRMLIEREKWRRQQEMLMSNYRNQMSGGASTDASLDRDLLMILNDRPNSGPERSAVSLPKEKPNHSRVPSAGQSTSPSIGSSASASQSSDLINKLTARKDLGGGTGTDNVAGAGTQPATTSSASSALEMMSALVRMRQGQTEPAADAQQPSPVVSIPSIVDDEQQP